MNILLRLILIVSDLLLIAVAFIVGDLLAVQLDTGSISQLNTNIFAQLNLFGYSSAVWMVLSWREGAYSLSPQDGWVFYFAAHRILLKTTFSVAVLLFLARIGVELQGAGLLFTLLVAFILIPVFAVLCRQLVLSYSSQSAGTLLIGDQQGIEHLTASPSFPRIVKRFNISRIALIDGDADNFSELDLPVTRVGEDLREYVNGLKVEQVLVNATHIGRLELSQILQKIIGSVSKLFVVPDISTLEIVNVEISSISGKPVLNYNQNLKSPANLFLKRTLDIVGALAGLIILGPLMLFVALMIKISSPGEIIYKHRRYGQGMRYIFMHKFRSMVINGDAVLEKLLAEDEDAKKEWESLCKLKNDPRITRIGKMIRRTSIDELPQIINVLKGDMSLVGPRPISELEYDKYGVWQKNFMSVRPGLTGLWQVSGRSDLDFDDRIKLDMYYIRNWSIWLDLKIILKTFSVLFSSGGAY
jgi:Undecaprenyl-phosphate galactose phosphotransferase WbaP